jgi:hypothetical protein
MTWGQGLAVIAAFVLLAPGSLLFPSLLTIAWLAAVPGVSMIGLAMMDDQSPPTIGPEEAPIQSSAAQLAAVALLLNLLLQVGLILLALLRCATS